MGAAAAALPSAADARAPRRRTTRRQRRADVAVVGAGLAGLTAARALVAHGRSVVVLEARKRVGGRLLNHRLGGGKVTEVGGEYIGPTQNHIAALARAMRVDTFPTFDTGDNVYFFGGSRSTYSDTGPTGTAPPDPEVAPDIAATVALLDTMSGSVPVDGPWRADQAADWDQQTLDTFIREHSASPRFRDLAAVATRAIFGAEPRDLSLLFVLFYIAASGDEQNPGTFERNFNTRDGAQMFRFHGGSQLIAQRIAARLGRHVLLNQPVRRITQSRAGAWVYTDRLTVRARRVIVSVPPTLAGRIDYRPILPELRDQLTQRTPQGTLIKAEAIYDRPFWRDQGHNGFAIGDTGPCNVTFDNTPPDNTPGVLFGFVGGDEARRFSTRPAAERRAAVLKNFTDYFGPAAASPRDYFERSWAAEPWTRGCPVAVFPPGVLLEYGPALRTPVGRIHWAGSETSTYWMGYMDGAVRSGERAAAEVLAEL